MDLPTEHPSGPDSTALRVPPVEPRQRWRLTFARDAVDADAIGRNGIDAWGKALAASGLAVSGLEAGGVGRPRLAIAAPLPASCSGLAELADLWLLERVQLWVLRESLADHLPPAHQWVGAEDVWLGAPPLPGQVTAAHWRIALVGAPDVEELRRAAATVLGSTELPRARPKGPPDRTYDLRPLVEDVTVERSPDGSVVLSVVTRSDPALGSGRPEEVVAALGEAARSGPLEISTIARTRIVLAEPGRSPAVTPPAGHRRR